ncbi:MAG: hypothetical protein K8S56_05980, partial [Candidatus Cloacimonetes bacterium]|nr:hypothetical protein [Candidatus Cloacimonadota bacterium]
MKHHSTRQISCLIVAILLAIIYYISQTITYQPAYAQIKAGQIADRDIVAPFTFTAYKSDKQIEKESRTAVHEFQHVYKIHESTNFTILKNLDAVFEAFSRPSAKGNPEQILTIIRENIFPISQNAVNYLINDDNRQSLHEYLINQIDNAITIGIFPDEYPDNTILINRNGDIREYSLRKLFSVQEVIERILGRIDNNTRKKTAHEILDFIITVNIFPDDEKNAEIKESLREDINPEIGKILQNEKIISKGNRVSEEDFQKLQSLAIAAKQQGIEQTGMELFFGALGIFILSCFLLWSLLYYWKFFIQTKLETTSEVVLIHCGVLFSAIAALSVHLLLATSVFLIPFGFVPFILASIFSPQIAII